MLLLNSTNLLQQVCFFKIANRPSANVTFHSCNTSFAVDLAGISPKPIFANPQAQLTSTVFHVWGKLNRTFDRNPQADNLLDYFDQYVKWTDPAKPNFLQVYMDSPGLINGYYNVWIEGSLATNYPDLVSLFGLDQYDDGSAKYMGVSLRNNSNKPVPIQTVKSKIAELSGPDVPVQLGSAATFTWETQGYGEQFCYVDGQKVANTADLVSWLTRWKVPQLRSSSAQHSAAGRQASVRKLNCTLAVAVAAAGTPGPGARGGSCPACLSTAALCCGEVMYMSMPKRHIQQNRDSCSSRSPLSARRCSWQTLSHEPPKDQAIILQSFGFKGSAGERSLQLSCRSYRTLTCLHYRSLCGCRSIVSPP